MLELAAIAAIVLGLMLRARAVQATEVAAADMAAAASEPGGFLSMMGFDVSPQKQAVAALVDRILTDENVIHFDLGDVLAFIEIESNFDPRAFRYEAKLGEGSMGLMQILPSTARDMGFSGDDNGLFDPETNVRMGVRYLEWLMAYLSKRRGRVVSKSDVVAAYNAGPGNVLKGFTPLLYVARWNAARLRYGS